MIERLLLPASFQTSGKAETIGVFKQNAAIRLFSKSDDVDLPVPVFFCGKINDADLKRYAEEIEKNRLLSFLTGKKIFLQLKNEDRSVEKPVSYYTFQWIDGHSGLEGGLILTLPALDAVFKILGLKNLQEKKPLPEVIKEAEKRIFWKLSAPPSDLPKYIVSLSDKNLQVLLNRLLHMNIASPNMLASYVHGLGENGKRILDNLSPRVRKQIAELTQAARITSSYRWADEVDYIIGRNLLIAAREEEIRLRGLEGLDWIRRLYQTDILKWKLSEKTMEEWLLDLHEKNAVLEMMRLVKRKQLASVLTDLDPQFIEKLFGKYISANGVKMLLEDREAAVKLPLYEKNESLFRVMRVIKNTLFYPIAVEMNFEQEVKSRIFESGAIELIADEIGFGQTVYALRGLNEWSEKVLDGILLFIYQDVLSGKVRLKNFGDYRIPQCRINFLTSLLILSDEEKI